jgi:TolB-like protein/Tfp pilus assembly protein PilF
MAENAKIPIRIDLNEFKLHIHFKKIQLTLHFNSPSRRFYLSVIALVVNEMKRLGKITSIPLEGHLALLVLLNETIGGSAGSSKKESLLPRIYRKWKDALPDVEDAPLFKVLGRRKEYDEGSSRTYPFAEAEKDDWANLFEYQGSEENVRLKFAIDRIGVTLDDIVIVYGDSLNGDAWERFISNLKERGEKSESLHGSEAILSLLEAPKLPVSPMERQKSPWQGRRRWAFFVTLIVFIAAVATLVTWKLYFKLVPAKKASVERMAFPLPDKPSIAVLPFVNISKEPGQEFFSDGMTEEITTSLSKSPYLFVVAHISTSKYKNRSVNVWQVSEDFGVRYVLEGSVRRSGGKIRITVRLIDAITGRHLWAERFDREIKEIFTVQDEIALKIMKTLHVKLQAGQLGSETGRGANNLEAFLMSMEAREQVLRYTKEGNARARKLFEEVIVLDPNYGRGYSGLAISYAAEVWLGTSKFPEESLAQAIKLGQKAVSLDGADATAQAVLAYLFAMTGQYDEAISQAERALVLDSNSYSVINNCGLALAYSGKHEESLPLLEKAARLNPAIAQSFVMSSMAYRIVGRHEDAFQHAKKAVELGPDRQLAQIALAATSILTGRDESAHAAAAEVLKINPTFSVERYGRALPFKDKSQIDIMMNALRRAGLK